MYTCVLLEKCWVLIVLWGELKVKIVAVSVSNRCCIAAVSAATS